MVFHKTILRQNEEWGIIYETRKYRLHEPCVILEGSHLADPSADCVSWFSLIFLRITGYPKSNCILITVVWGLVFLVWLSVHYFSRRNYFKKMKEMMEQIDQRYLLGELMPDSVHLEDQIYRELIRKSNKSVIERIRAIEDEKKEYQEYIESWVHEIKAPITGIDLMCENHKETLTRRIALENRKIENYVDMALYYARSDEVYQDYMIRETDLG